MAQQFPVAVGSALAAVLGWSPSVAWGGIEDFSQRLAEEAAAMTGNASPEPTRGRTRWWAWRSQRAERRNA